MRYRDLLEKSKAFFSEAERKSDVERLMVWLSKKSRASFLAHLDDEADDAFIREFEVMLDKLKIDIPLQYILGFAYFDGEAFKVTEATLIPRFDTEVLLDFAKRVCSKRELNVLDLCTGSGILAISLAKEGARVYASDISTEALEVAKENAKSHEVQIDFRLGDLFDPWEGMTFDLIVSNPPYIDDEGMEAIDKRVKKEPHLALYGGKDGLDFYKKIIPKGRDFLSNDGLLAVEIGYNQGHLVSGLFEEYGYQGIIVLKDNQGLDRVVVGRRK